MSDATATLPPQRLLQPTAATAWIVLGLLLVSNLPAFICMPLTNDVAMYDLQALTLMHGGVLYRDILEPNLPGIVWIHVAIRSLLGTSSEAIRAVDAVIFSGIVLLLVGCLRGLGKSTATQAWTAFILFLFYLSISEWSHCQRDVWLLLPALGGLLLRCRQIARAASPATNWRQIAMWGFVEGTCWAAGVWLKPLIVVPALACWIVSALQIRRIPQVLIDLAALLAGGLVIGAAGILWLHLSGTWPHFYETLVEWNPRYFAAGKEHWTALRFAGMVYRFSPWILLHAVALPLALVALLRGGIWSSHATDRDERQRRALFAALYLAWLGQSFFLQHLFDYVHAPAILLAIAFLAGRPQTSCQWRVWRPAVTGFLVVAILSSPVLTSKRLGCWLACWREGSTPALRNRLALLGYPNWEDMQRVADRLHELDVQDGQVACYNNDLVYLYQQLGIRPPNRFVYLEALLAFFPDRGQLIRRELSESAPSYMVTDLHAVGLTNEEMQSEGAASTTSLPTAFPEELQRHFPWGYPVVFRAGSIVIHKIPRQAESPDQTVARSSSEHPIDTSQTAAEAQPGKYVATNADEAQPGNTPARSPLLQ